MRQALTLIFLVTLLGLSLYYDRSGSTRQSPSSGGGGGLADEANLSEVSQGGFLYRLVSEKAVYKAGEPVRLYAELVYTGPEQSVEIRHGGSPFWFPIRERTRGYEIPYVMNQPLLVSKLVRGTPFREEYKGGGAYSEQDGEDLKAFMKAVGQGQFPAGHYTVEGRTDFYTGTGEPVGNRTDYKLNARIEFEVQP